MASLFQITEKIVALETIVNLLDGSSEDGIPGGPESMSESLSRYLTKVEAGSTREEIEAELAEKIDGYVSYVRHLQARQKARKEEAKAINSLAAQDGRKIDKMREAVIYAADALERAKLVGHTRSITVSTSKRPAVSWDDPATLPPQFTQAEAVLNWKVDRKALTNHIMETGELPDGVTIRPVTSVRFR